MNGKVISGPAAVLIVVLFFLPWIAVSCEGQPVGEFSGYQLATNIAPEGGQDVVPGGEINGDLILFIIPLAGIVTLIFLGVTLWKSSFEPVAGWGQIIASFLGFLVLFLEWFQLRGEVEAAIQYLVRPALWGTAACLVAIGAGAVFDLVRSSRKRPTQLAAPSRKSTPQYQPAFPAAPADFGGDYGDAGHTILDEDLYGAGGHGSETILDEDAFGVDAGGNVTILDEDYLGDDLGSHTVLGDDLLGDDSTLTPQSTPVDIDDTAVGGGAYNLVWAVPEETPASQPDDVTPPELPPAPEPRQSPTAPPSDSGVQKTEVLHVESEAMAWLVIGSGDRRGEQFRLFADTTLGRDTSNDIVLDDTALSNRHARIRGDEGRFFVFDQNSTNGVFVFDKAKNRWEKRDAYELQDGDQIKFGRTVLHFMMAK